MTSTHTGNPICCAAALANLKKIVNDDLAGNAAKVGQVLERGLCDIQKRNNSVIGHFSCRGLVAGLQFIKPGSNEPNHDLAHNIIERCFEKGLLMFSPVGAWGQTVKIAPPLTITENAIQEGLEVLNEAVTESIASFGAIREENAKGLAAEPKSKNTQPVRSEKNSSMA